MIKMTTKRKDCSQDAKIMTLNSLRANPKSTGGEIWKFLKDSCENQADRRFLSSNFSDQDQTARKILAELVASGLVVSAARCGTFLTEYTASIRK